MIRRHGALATLAVAILAAGCPRPRAPSPPAPPRLVVSIVIDQLPSYTFEARRSLFRHGLARLVRESVYWQRAVYPYAYTYTAAGHAALGTGAPPRVTGVIGNSWYRRATRRVQGAEWDTTAPLVTPSGGPDRRFGPDDGVSGRALQVGGLAEAIRASGRGRSVSLALKARAACFLAGRRPDVAVWFEDGLGGFTTSTAYADRVPAWVTAAGIARPWSRFFKAVWHAGDPALLARVTGIPDASPGESTENGLGTAFPHDVGAAKDPARALAMTPFGDELVADLAIAAIDGERLGADDTPDLLALSFASHDYVGHIWGQGSWEQVDVLLKLDIQLGRLFDALDAKVGADRYAVVLTSDHGATPLIERSPHAGARRIPTRVIEAAATDAMADVLGPGAWIAGTTAMTVYFAPELGSAAADAREAAIQAAIDAIERVPGIADAGRTAALATACPGGPAMAAICASIRPGESGDLYLVPTRGSLVTDYVAGTHHDAPSPDNHEVPLLVRAPGVAPRIVAAPVSTLRVAPTIAVLLGVRPPAAAQESALLPLATPASAAAKNGE